MKKIVSTIVTFCMLFGLFALPANAAKEATARQAVIECFETERGTNPYVDVHPNEWFYEYVLAMYASDLMTGLSKDTFGPYVILARAQFAVIVYRFMGGDAVWQSTIEQNPEAFPNRFADVEEEQWYTNAVKFAAAAGIVTGYTDSGLFGTGDEINREQMAVMMYRLAEFINKEQQDETLSYDLSTKAELTGYADYKSVNEFAERAMEWVVSQGIITGKDYETRLDPQGSATRAECATIVTRFILSAKA